MKRRFMKILQSEYAPAPDAMAATALRATANHEFEVT
jgi:hypothetical protein